MENVKYIPGDLVRVKKSALHFQNEDVFFKVISSLSGGILKVVLLEKNNSAVYSITNNAVRSTPITEELLREIGWNEIELVMEESVIDYYRYTNKDRIIKIRYYPKIKTFEATLDDVPLCELHDLIDLQHLLFGLGLSSELKV